MKLTPGRLPVHFDRKFHLGGYIGGHSQLLFRSGKIGYVDGLTVNYSSVLDIVFKNVAAIAVPESFTPLEISVADDAGLERFRAFLDCPTVGRTLYVLTGGTSVGYVLAGALLWVDDPLGSTDEVSVLLTDSLRARETEVFRA